MDNGDFSEGAWDQQALLEVWYDEYHRQTFGIGCREAAGAPPDLGPLFQRWTSIAAIHEKVCVEWNYCHKKQSLGKPSQVATALADFLAPLLGFSTNGALSVAFLMIEFGFDSICHCDPDAASKSPKQAA